MPPPKRCLIFPSPSSSSSSSSSAESPPIPPPKMAPAAAAVAANKKEAAAPAAAAAAQQVALEEKSARYRFLWQELQALEEDHKHPGMLDAAFLKMEDAKAAELDNKIKQQKVAESKVFNQWWGVKNDAIKALGECMK